MGKDYPAPFAFFSAYFVFQKKPEQLFWLIANRGSRFVIDFHILKARFKICTRNSTFVATFPFPPVILCYNFLMAG